MMVGTLFRNEEKIILTKWSVTYHLHSPFVVISYSFRFQHTFYLTPLIEHFMKAE